LKALEEELEKIEREEEGTKVCPIRD
jgi:hypothetical protein